MRIALAATAFLSLALASPASAGVFQDDLSRCLISKASAADRTIMARWMFSAVSSGSALKGMSTLTDADRLAHNQAMGKVFSRLLVQDCRAQLMAALKNEGPTTIPGASEALGQAVGTMLFSSPEAVEELNSFANFLDVEGLGKVAEQAGLTVKK